MAPGPALGPGRGPGAVGQGGDGLVGRRPAGGWEELLSTVRMESNFIPEIRPSMMVMFAAFDLADRAEAEVIPALMAGSIALAQQTASQAPPRARSASDVARNLRSNRPPPTEQVTEEETQGLLRSFGRMMGWIRR